MPFSLRRNLRFGSRCDLRPSPALVSQPPRQINTKAPPHTIHSARAHNTQAHPHRNTRAAALEHGQDNPPRDQLGRQPLRDQGHQPTNRRCAPGPAGSHACIGALPSVGPAAARARERDRCTCCRCTRARARRPLTRLPQLRARRGAPASARRTTCAPHRHVRTRRLACFADGLRVAAPVQAAAAASGRARRPPHPRHLRHDQQARRRLYGHDDPTAVTPALSRSAQAARSLSALQRR